MELNVLKTVKLLESNGPLHQTLRGYQPRKQQQDMMADIIEAYNHDRITLIEAGTGTGKSLAYLIPAILWARQNSEKTVISTNTINLQEQLIHKDIPTIAEALNVEVKAVLVKGMRNYVCLRKLEEGRLELPMLPPEEAQEFNKIEAWNQITKDGSRATLPFVPTSNTWDRVCAENDTCTKNKCPYFQDCHFFKARSQTEDAHILVVNHHLLFADLSLRSEEENYKDPAVLPAYQRVILDEAHHIEDVATEYFADRVSRLDLLRTLGRLAADKQGKAHGKLPLLKEKIVEQYKSHSATPTELTPIMTALNIDLPGSRHDITTQLFEMFDSFHQFLDMIKPRSNDEGAPGENKLRILPQHATHPEWTNKIVPKMDLLVDTLKRYVHTLEKLANNVKQLDNDRLKEFTKGLLFEVNALGVRLTGAAKIMESFVKNHEVSKVKWIEAQNLKSIVNVHLVNAELEINKALANFLFSKMSTIILCSATLTTNKHFAFVRNRLGILPEFLDKKSVTESIYESPFNYPQQAMLAIPTDIPDPSHPQFIAKATENIWQAIQTSKGNAFVLFTSYSMLKLCHQNLVEKLQKNRYNVLKQGDDNRQTLLTKFKETDRSILFGTDSFWEGVDVVGEALRCVIIVKLPFKVPSEPIIQARTEAISAKGGDPFMEYSLPNAIVKFKQGFGRLIRNHTDRGVIVCLDGRLLTKRYGQEFLNSLPKCQQAFTPTIDLEKQMQEFYKKTFYLTKKQ